MIIYFDFHTLDHVSSNVQAITVGNAVQVKLNWPEVTAVAYGPGEHASCPNGRLVFGNGPNIVATDLAGHVVAEWTAPLNETYSPVIIQDNHLVKTKNGALIYTFEGVTWNDNISPHPKWWDKTVMYPLKEQSNPGGRGNIYVFRSTDCGATWNHVSDIDAAKLTVANVDGLCGVPRLKTKVVKDDSGKTIKIKYSEAGGWDAHFLYADPYSGDLFLTTPYAYGSSKEGEEFKGALLLVSRDGGSTWSVIGHKPGHWIQRAPVSSINSGKVGFAFRSGTDLKYSIFDASTNTVNLFQAATIATYTIGNPPPTIMTDSFHNNLWMPSLAGNNLNPPRFYASAFNMISGQSTFNLYNVTATTATQLGNPVRPHTAGGAVVQGSFIDPLPNSTIAVFYWIDIDPSKPNKYSVRFQVLSHGEPLLAEPGQLTVQDPVGFPYTWQYDTYTDDKGKQHGLFMGDYHTGAAYQDGNSIKFVAPWSQNGSLHFNTITVAPPAARPWIANWSFDGLGLKWQELDVEGYELIDLSAMVLVGDQVRYNAIWTKSDDNHPRIWGWTLQDLMQEDKKLYAQGYRMIDVSAMVLAGDQVRYNAIWTKSSDDHTWIGGWTFKDLTQEDKKRAAQGYELVNLSAMVLVGDQVRYNAIWTKSDDNHPRIWGWTLQDLMQEDKKLYAQGYRMIDVSAMVLAGDQVRYNAIWTKSSDDHPWIGGWAPEDFIIQNVKMNRQGYQMKKLNTFVMSGDQVRYNAIWEPI